MITALLGIFAILGLAFLGVPLGFSMLLVGAAGFAILRGVDPALSMIAQQVVDNSANYGWSVLPMFILMGVFVHRAEMSDELYDAAYAWLGHLRGGLAHATVASCAMFAAISGSSIATAATMSKVAIPPMRRLGYADSLAAGSVASAGVLGVLIPPSVPLIIYGILTEQDIRALFIATVGPGILATLLFIGAVWLTTLIWPHLGPRGESHTWRQKFAALENVWSVLLLFVLVMGGLYGGVFTATESAGMGAAGAFLIALARRKLSRSAFLDCLVESSKTTAMIFVIAFGAMVFANFVALSGMVGALIGWIEDMRLPATGVIVAIAAIYLVLGCLMESLGLMILTVPVFAGVMQSLGVNLVWFGVFVVMMIEIGMLTPPVGMNVFTVKTMNPEIPLKTIFKGVMPFVIANLLAVAIMVAWPQIATAPLAWLN
ncbi:MAG: C4-dicarboxylate ABC transporter permease [Betaproteobacteria bacterium RIFCSPLOWO2_12_FULL_67_28]|nr:MAG: C4-dicarboxylate ABC transporter permease [Betaproteobacteria bacterium RIFCSPLOWO2_12_FULL_67_28]